MSEIQDAAIAFVNQLKPADRVMVISFDDHINVLTEPTSDRDTLTRAIRRTETGNGTRLYDAVEQVMTKYMKDVSGRKAVVLFTDGVDTTSRKASYEKTVREAEESDMVFYPVAYDTYQDMGAGNSPGQWPSRRGRGGMGGGFPFPNFPGGGGGWPGGGGRGGRGPGSSREDYERADQYLHDIAQKSGGRFYGGDTLQDISQAFAQVAEGLRRQYSLGYYPKSSGQAGDRRQIKVRVNQPDLVVTSRDSYVYSANKTAPPQSNDPQQVKPTP
jgi:VWFA-related protein